MQWRSCTSTTAPSSTDPERRRRRRRGAESGPGARGVLTGFGSPVTQRSVVARSGVARNPLQTKKNRDSSGELQVALIGESIVCVIGCDLVREEELPGGAGQSAPTTAINDRALALPLNFVAG